MIKTRVKSETYTIFLFSVYIVMLLWIIIFKCGFSITLMDNMRSINLIPFYYANEISVSFHITEVLENVAVFLPFGLFLSMLKKKTKAIIMSALILSISFESMQYIFAIGATDITDVITNTIGTLIGICLYKVMIFLFEDNEKLNRAINIIITMGICLMVLILSTLLVLNS